MQRRMGRGVELGVGKENGWASMGPRTRQELHGDDRELDGARGLERPLAALLGKHRKKINKEIKKQIKQINK